MLLRDAPDKEKYGLLGRDADGRLIEFLGESFFDAEVVEELMYTGVQVFSHEVFSWMPENRQAVFSVTRDTYPKLLAAQKYISTSVYEGYFNDVGTPERLEIAQSRFPAS